VNIGLGLALGLTAVIGSCARVPPPCPALVSNGPTTGARRDHCLAPPWVIDPQRPASGVNGWSAARCAGPPGASAYFIHDGARTLTDDELFAVQRTIVASIGAGATTGIGGCCSPEVAARTKVACLKIWTGLCVVSMSQLVDWVDDALRQHGLEGGRMGVDISVGGAVGPRCEPNDPACGPLDARDPYGAAVRSQPGCATGRVPLASGHDPDAPERVSAGQCTHDGECVIDSCESRCAAWNTASGGTTSCDDRGRDEEEPAYCGCVSGRCAWFLPALR